MRKATAPLTLILVLLAAAFVSVAKPASAAEAVTENSWTTKAPMQVARGGLGVASANGKIYAIGGSNESGYKIGPIFKEVVGTNEEYDPISNTWAFKASMPTPRFGFATAAYQNKIYCIGGMTTEGFTGVNEVYDSLADSWETKAPMLTARSGLQANVVGGKIYLIGGYPASNRSLNEIYDPTTDSWITKTAMPIGEGSFASGGSYSSAAIDNKIYIIGEISSDGKRNLNQIYDTLTDSWSYGKSPPALVYGVYFGLSTAVATTGEKAPKRIYLFSAEPSSNQVYDPETDSWITGKEMPTRREHLGVAVVNDVLYAIGGRSYSFPYPSGDYNESTIVCAANEQYTPIGYGTPDPSYSSSTSATSPIQPSSPTTITANNESEPFPLLPVAVASVATVAVAAAGLLVYFKKRKREGEHA